MIHCHRWREIEISSPADLDGSRKVFPVLRKVAVSTWSHALSKITIVDAPLLCEASIAANYTTWRDVRLPWVQLTSLSLETFDALASCLFILRHCPKLHTLKYRAVQAPSTLILDPPITLESLNSLEVYNSCCIIPHLTLPALHQLTLSMEIASAIDPLRALLSRSSFQLQQLTIILLKNDRTKSDELKLLHQLFPTVTDLKLEIRAVTGLHRIIGSLSSLETLPLVKNLTIDAVRVRDEYDSLLEVLRTQCSPDAGTQTLERFGLILCPQTDPGSPSASTPLPKSAAAQFGALAKSGLTCHISL
ncbi:hypothetical protein B0H17DRAFT_125798 [Mycena rosella]|uniref:F-box domain-containing protein n=1 Tax=Mycena rosella TaxID=1033263 RepID=A0AAD7G7Z8_MYCRO|nr:hypothetical protein B0H17DRAFT_125798 [Mycena rosella]